MGILDKTGSEWEQLFVQINFVTGNSVACMVNKQTKKRVYFDIEANRVLSKREALNYTIDLTGRFPLPSAAEY